MASTSEAGSKKTIDNLGELTTSVVLLGTTFKPSNPLLLISAQIQLKTDAQKAFDDVSVALGIYNEAANQREIAYEPLSSLSTQIVNALDAAGASQQSIENARTFVRKIRGDESLNKLTDEEIAALKAEGKEYHSHSTSQMSFDNREANFGYLIDTVAAVEEYNPNEEFLQIVNLRKTKADLSEKNATAVAKEKILRKSRLDRNIIFNTPKSGLVAVANGVKKYIKSVFGANSAQFKDVAALKFSKIK